jgi:hypothetical protein
LAGGLVTMASSPASADESEASEASDLIDLDSIVTLDLLKVGLDAKLDVAGTGVVDASVAVGP